ncbi:MAG: ABC transporter permease [Spirochaetaceae bacterium]|nr:ABC transporter permease [Spirochaetaceae bacterium]
MRFLMHNKLCFAGLLLIAALIFLAIFAPLLVPYSQDIANEVHLENKLLPPQAAHPFGTDEMGRDVFLRVLYGARLSFQLAFVVILISSAIGISYGLVSGYFGGVVDTVMMRLCEIFLSFPSLLLAIAIVSVLGPSLTNTAISIALSWWPWFARLIRNETVSLKSRGFVEAARAMAVSPVRILYDHILRNTIPVIIVQVSLSFGSVILTAASLSFLGLGVQSPLPEWGLMVSTGKNYFLSGWWYVTFPGIFIFITVMAFNFFGDGLRDFYDPKTRYDHARS